MKFGSVLKIGTVAIALLGLIAAFVIGGIAIFFQGQSSGRDESQSELRNKESQIERLKNENWRDSTEIANLHVQRDSLLNRLKIVERKIDSLIVWPLVIRDTLLFENEGFALFGGEIVLTCEQIRMPRLDTTRLDGENRNISRREASAVISLFAIDEDVYNDLRHNLSNRLQFGYSARFPATGGTPEMVYSRRFLFKKNPYIVVCTGIGLLKNEQPSVRISVHREEQL